METLTIKDELIPKEDQVGIKGIYGHTVVGYTVFELLNEPENKQTYKDVRAWLNLVIKKFSFYKHNALILTRLHYYASDRVQASYKKLYVEMLQLMETEKSLIERLMPVIEDDFIKTLCLKVVENVIERTENEIQKTNDKFGNAINVERSVRAE